MSINYKLATKMLLTDLFKNNFSELDNDDWSLTDSDVDDIINLRNSIGGTQRFDDLVECGYRIDTNSKRPMTKGYVCYGGDAYFIEQDDALAWLNKDGHNYDSWEEAHNDTASDDEGCYYTEWV